MKINLDSLRTEILDYLNKRGIVVFHSMQRGVEMEAPVYWDTIRYPDYRMFLTAAEAAGVKFVAVFAREFSEAFLEGAIEQVAETHLPREERRAIEKGLKEIRGYAGFTGQVELSFDLGQRVYIFELRTDWFEDLHELLERLDEAEEDEDEEADRGPLGGGYFSKN